MLIQCRHFSCSKFVDFSRSYTFIEMNRVDILSRLIDLIYFLTLVEHRHLLRSIEYLHLMSAYVVVVNKTYTFVEINNPTLFWLVVHIQLLQLEIIYILRLEDVRVIQYLYSSFCRLYTFLRLCELGIAA